MLLAKSKKSKNEAEEPVEQAKPKQERSLKRIFKCSEHSLD